MEYKHTPVMIQEAIDHLAIKRGGYYIDCTLGSGAYTEAISAKVGPEGKVVSFDLDEKAIENAKKKKLKNTIFINDNYRNIKKDVHEVLGKDILFDGIVFDLGLSSYQLDDDDRGFSFRSEGPLDMAFGPKSPRSTEEIVNKYSEKELKRIIAQYGEEKEAGKIARAIVKERAFEPITTASQLAQIIIKVKIQKSKKIHPATKTFQALRMETNDELPGLKKALSSAVDLLKDQGRLVLVSFHSLEDRIVKRFFKEKSLKCVCPPSLPVCACGKKQELELITKKPIEPSEREIKDNPRARSAKLRVAQKPDPHGLKNKNKTPKQK
ncbi:16S rRNA (cytosine(1402)-N(4))-methyltransferase RsmH [Candidatus Falkowbacteria bacterium]|nr:16S rRNA (cytosine(1402)-N(4))-methyltransferase RsmH [Candidatus Falkowbacteria bacterium]